MGTRPLITSEEWAVIGERLGIPPRQMQIVQAIMDGHGKPQSIAQRLGIKPGTVKTHIDRLYRNLGCHDRVEVVVTVFRELIRMRAN